jgi:hypothetical protein
MPVITQPRGYFSAPWRKARICARVLLRPAFQRRARYVRLVRGFAADGSVSNRLIEQALAHLRARQRDRANAPA